MMNRLRDPRLLFFLFALFISFQHAGAQTHSKGKRVEHPVELGKIAWHRGFDRALELSRKSDKPLLVLFQEVPG